MFLIDAYLIGVALAISGYLWELIVRAEEHEWSNERIQKEIQETFFFVLGMALVPGLNYVEGIAHLLYVLKSKKGDRLNSFKKRVVNLVAKKIIKIIKKGNIEKD